MAGIGFELRKLSRRDDLLGMVEGYLHSAIASTGPWLFTIFALASITLFGERLVSVTDLTNFRLIIIYNFAFSLLFSGCTTQVATRYLADSIFMKKVEDAPSMLVSALVVMFALSALAAVPFYLVYIQLDLTVRLLALANFFVVMGIWLESIFLTALKDYDSISTAFAVGMLSALVLAVCLGVPFGMPGMLLGFTLGLAVIFFSLLAKIFAEYPYPVTRYFRFAPYMRRYWDLAVGGVLYNAGIWVDKWIMWFAPQRFALDSGLVSYPDYDAATFLAYITIVPSMAAFVLSVETDFFEKYLAFYRDIQRHATFDEIAGRQGSVVASVLRGARLFLVLQGAISLSAVLLAPRIFTWLNINYSQIGVFRIAVLGAFFHVLFLAILIILCYFDLRVYTLRLQALFFLSNVLFTVISMGLGFRYYGYGYFAACIVTCVASFIAMSKVLNRLAYQTFVLGNSSVRR